MATFGQRFKELRSEKRLTQQQLADNFYLNKSSISRYEQNKQIPEIDLLQKLADFFNVSVDYLLGRSDIRNPQEDENDLTPEEQELLEKIKSDPELSILFHDLKSAPKKKIKQLLKTWEFVKDQFDNWDDEE